jgi:hypothetical protein
LEKLQVYEPGSPAAATLVYSACVSSGASPRFESARTSLHPAGASIDEAEATRTSIAASSTSPETTPAGLESVNERTLRSDVTLDIPRNDGVGLDVRTDAEALGASRTSATRSASVRRTAPCG